MEKTAKIFLISSGVFVVAVSSNIVANAIYTNSKIGIDKKSLLIAGGIGIATTFLLLKYLKID